VRWEHVAESGRGGVVEGPPLAKDDHFDELGTGGGVEWAEGAVGVAGDNAAAGEPINRLVEILAGRYVSVVLAGERRWGVRRTRRARDTRGSGERFGWRGGLGACWADGPRRRLRASRSFGARWGNGSCLGTGWRFSASGGPGDSAGSRDGWGRGGGVA
jgi:hypothetical protein